MGWYAPAELPDGDQGVTFAVPCIGRSLEDSYACSVVQLDRDGLRVWFEARIIRASRPISLGPLVRERSIFVLQGRALFLPLLIRPMMQWRRIPYRGDLKHPDFEHGMTELVPVFPQQFDSLVEQRRLVVMGTDPADYTWLDGNTETGGGGPGGGPESFTELTSSKMIELDMPERGDSNGKWFEA